jgi:hypothetical protein
VNVNQVNLVPVKTKPASDNRDNSQTASDRMVSNPANNNRQKVNNRDSAVAGNNRMNANPTNRNAPSNQATVKIQPRDNPVNNQMVNSLVHNKVISPHGRRRFRVASRRRSRDNNPENLNSVKLKRANPSLVSSRINKVNQGSNSKMVSGSKVNRRTNNVVSADSSD